MQGRSGPDLQLDMLEEFDDRPSLFSFSYSPSAVRNTIIVQVVIGLGFLFFTAIAVAVSGSLLTLTPNIISMVLVGVLWVLWTPCLLLCVVTLIRTCIYFIKFKRDRRRTKSPLVMVTVATDYSRPDQAPFEEFSNSTNSTTSSDESYIAVDHQNTSKSIV